MSDHMIPMDCNGLADQLSVYLEGDAPDAVRVAIEAHAASCAGCGALLADIAGIRTAAVALPVLTPSRDLWSGIAERIAAPVAPLAASRASTITRRSWLRPSLAAAALVLITAGVTHVLTRASFPAKPANAVAASATPAPQQVAQAPQPVTVADQSADISDVAGKNASRSVKVENHDVQSSASSAVRRLPSRASSAPPRTDSRLRLARNTRALPQGDPVYGQEITKLRRLVRERRSQLDPSTIAVLEQSIAVIDSAIAQSRAALARDPASGFLTGQLNHSLEKKVELLRTAALLPART